LQPGGTDRDTPAGSAEHATCLAFVESCRRHLTARSRMG
jgi:hypothetical protein